MFSSISGEGIVVVIFLAAITKDVPTIWASSVHRKNVKFDTGGFPRW